MRGLPLRGNCQAPKSVLGRNPGTAGRAVQVFSTAAGLPTPGAYQPRRACLAHETLILVVLRLIPKRRPEGSRHVPRVSSRMLHYLMGLTDLF